MTPLIHSKKRSDREKTNYIGDYLPIFTSKNLKLDFSHKQKREP